MKPAQIAEDVEYEGIEKDRPRRKVVTISEQGEVTYLEKGQQLKCSRREFAAKVARPYRDPNTRKPKEARSAA